LEKEFNDFMEKYYDEMRKEEEERNKLR